MTLWQSSGIASSGIASCGGRVPRGGARCSLRFGRAARTLIVVSLAGAVACAPTDGTETSTSSEQAPPAAAAAATETEDAAPSPTVSAPAEVSVPTATVPSAEAAEGESPSVSASDISVPSAPVAEESIPASSTLPAVDASTTSQPSAAPATTTSLAPAAAAVTVTTTSSAPSAEVSATAATSAVVTTTAPPVTTTSAPPAEVPAPVTTTSLPSVVVPTASAPVASVPVVSLPQVELPVAAEVGAGYARDEWGPHNSGLCRGAVGSVDPYTGTRIDTCNVDHVVALLEAHESGGRDWSSGKKQRFSQDPSNHVASRACVNQSKGADDISEWSDADIASSSACGGGYRVTAQGRCFLAVTTVAVKADWGLAVDQAEADALSATLAGCGAGSPDFEPAERVAPSTTAVPPAATPAPRDCVIAGRSAADYQAVSGIGRVLAARLVEAQPFRRRADLQAVSGIGPARSEAVWSHFCGS